MKTTDCKSRDGITIGLIDSLLAIARVLAPRLHRAEKYTSGEGWIPQDVREALRDLHEDTDINYIMIAGPYNKNWVSDDDRNMLDSISTTAKYLRENQILIDVSDIDTNKNAPE